MTHTFSSILYHIVWSTKKRAPLIGPIVKPRLYAYIRKLMENEKCQVIALNGMPDHIHLLISINQNVQLPVLMRNLKSGTTKWMRSEIPNCQSFAWQEGYGVFSVGMSTKNNVIAYIENQEKHHATVSFEEEYLEFLKKHSIDYDPRFVLG